MMFGNLEDPMINWGLRNLSRTFSAVFFLSCVFVLAYFSREVKIVLALTIVSTGLIFLLMMITSNEYGYAF